MPNKALVSGAVAAIGVVSGVVAGRAGWGHKGVQLRLNGNEKMLSRQDLRLVAALIENGHGHLFKHWPAPGVGDDKKRALLTAAGSYMAGAGPALEPARLATLVPPVARPKNALLESHGEKRIDPYYWLRDDSRLNPDVLSHLTAETAYTIAALADTEALQETLYTEMRGRIQEADQSVPVRQGGYMYYTRTEEGAQYCIHCRRRVPPGAGPPSEADSLDESMPEEVLLDENKRKESGRHAFYMVGGLEPSPDHQRLAWMEDTVGGERYTLHVKDLVTGKEVMAPITDTSGDVEWGADNATLFYVVKDAMDRPHKVYRYTTGKVGGSTLVYEELDESFYLDLSKSRSEQVVFIHAGSAITSETRFISASTPEAEFKVILPRTQDVEYSVSHRGEHFYITRRTADKPNSELLVAPMDNPAQLRVLMEHDPSVKVEDVVLCQDYVAVFTRSGGLQRAKVYALPAGLQPPTAKLSAGTEVTFDEPAYSLDPGSQGDFESPVLRMAYTSLTTPRSILDQHMGSGQRATKKVQPVLGGFRQEDYVTERLWANSKDGTVKIPISLVYRKGAVKLDGSDPMLLNGYGSYEICNDPDFRSYRLCLLDRGFIFALAHVRGGGEMGRSWYEDGKFLKKQNTFDDFVSCAEHLVSHKYTSPARLCIEGRSAGGLLMGAVLNMRPDLFNAVILGVPFVDALTTVLDETIPLTIIEWEEWGNPKSSKEFYDYMLSYSPMDNVKPAHYPHVFAQGGLHDPRVGYWEPAKFVARLRAAKLDDNLLLFKCDMGAGHFSVTGRFERLKETALEFAFLLKVQGMLDVAPAKAAVASA